jgi:hypothetical protein
MWQGRDIARSLLSLCPPLSTLTRAPPTVTPAVGGAPVSSGPGNGTSGPPSGTATGATTPAATSRAPSTPSTRRNSSAASSDVETAGVVPVLAETDGEGDTDACTDVDLAELAMDAETTVMAGAESGEAPLPAHLLRCSAPFHCTCPLSKRRRARAPCSSMPRCFASALLRGPC